MVEGLVPPFLTLPHFLLKFFGCMPIHVLGAGVGLAHNNKAGYMKLCEYLKQCRKKMGITQADLGKQLGGKTGQYISAIESGRASISLRTLPRLMEAYEASPAVVLDLLVKEYTEVVGRILGVGPCDEEGEGL